MNTKNTRRLKVMTILGTRPEIIRLSCVLPKLDKYSSHIVVYTNQNYDYELSQIFFKELKLRKPDYLLNVKSETLGEQISKVIKQSEEVILKEKPDVLLVLGDTNSTLSAIVARRMKIPIFHMEAGNRCFDWEVPEETNRRIVDHISAINLPYTEHARRYLISEGIRQETIFVTGSPLAEVLCHYEKEIQQSQVLKHLGLKPRKYFLVNIQREENVDNPRKFTELLKSLNYVADVYNLPIVVSLHPRTKKKLKKVKIKLAKQIILHQPFGYFDYNKLQKEALCVLSDSGTIQEESAMFGFRAVQIRTSSERPEAFDTGSIILTGVDKETIINAIDLVIDLDKDSEPIIIPKDYQDKNVSTKVVKLILGLGSIFKYQQTSEKKID